MLFAQIYMLRGSSIVKYGCNKAHVGANEMFI